ncbi:MAG: phage tail tube protein [Defluviitaleaceae bacterium]|nr:phage tail tube protein [Defluviitaleaceae bacterium]
MPKINQTVRSQDLVTGALARCFANIDGNNEDMFYARNVTATVKKKKKEIPVLGQTGTKHKSGGWTGTGKMSLYYVTTLYRRMMLTYAKDGVDTYFDMLVENVDPTSDTGRQSILLKNVNLDSVDITKLDITAEELEEDIDFTFDDFEIMQDFDTIVGE